MPASSYRCSGSGPARADARPNGISRKRARSQGSVPSLSSGQPALIMNAVLNTIRSLLAENRYESALAYVDMSLSVSSLMEDNVTSGAQDQNSEVQDESSEDDRESDNGHDSSESSDHEQEKKRQRR